VANQEARQVDEGRVGQHGLECRLRTLGRRLKRVCIALGAE
jgi:hypothetical protein